MVLLHAAGRDASTWDEIAPGWPPRAVWTRSIGA